MIQSCIACNSALKFARQIQRQYKASKAVQKSCTKIKQSTSISRLRILCTVHTTIRWYSLILVSAKSLTNHQEKSSIEFRGSPTFCSQQMTKLLGTIKEAPLVDVYYNDMVGLKISISQIKFENSYEKSDKENQFRLLVDEQLQMLFATHLLKYNIWRKKKGDIILLLKYKQCQLLRKKGKITLQIFQLGLFSLFTNIYNQLRQQFHQYIESGILQAYFRRNQTSYTFRNSKKEFKHDRFQKRLLKKQEETSQISCSKYKEYLQIQKVFDDQNLTEQSYHIIIQFLRFDVKNNDLGEKIFFANKFNRAHKHQNQLDIGSKKKTFSLIFEYCLKPPYTLWKKQHIYIVLNQLLMLDFNLEPYIQQMFASLESMNETVIDSIMCAIEIEKILFMLTFKHQSEHSCMKEEIPNQMYLFAKKLIYDSIFLNKVQHQFDLKCVILAFRQQFAQTETIMTQQGYRKIIDRISQIKNKYLREYLLQYFTTKYIQIIFLSRHHGSIYEILSKLLQKNKEKFYYSAFHIAKIFIFINNYKELHHLYTNIIDCINCIEISSKYKFEMSIFLFSQTQNRQELLRYSLELLDSPSSLFSIKNSTQLSRTLLKIQKCQNFVQSYPQVINRLAQAFLAHYHLFQFDQLLDLKHLEYIMLSRNIVLFFLKFCPASFGDQMITSRLSLIQQKMIKNKETDQQKYIYYQFKYETYLSAYYLATKRFHKLTSSYVTLYEISKFLNNEKSQFYFLKNLILSAVSVNNLQLLKQFIFEFYDIAKSLTSVTRYFQEKRQIFIAITLYCLIQNHQQNQFYYFWLILSLFLNNFPTEENIYHLYQNMERLMRTEHYLALMSYEKLSKLNSRNYCFNRYFVLYFIFALRFGKKQKNQAHIRSIFRKFAQSLNYLKFGAKKIIMKESIGFVIDYFKDNWRKQNYLICKWGYRFLPKEKLKKYYMKKVSGRKFERFYEKKINHGLLA